MICGRLLCEKFCCGRQPSAGVQFQGVYLTDTSIVPSALADQHVFARNAQELISTSVADALMSVSHALPVKAEAHTHFPFGPHCPAGTGIFWLFKNIWSALHGVEVVVFRGHWQLLVSVQS